MLDYYWTMALTVWQESLADSPSIDVITPAQTPFFDAKKFFAVDSSGSTMGAIMRAQAKAVSAFQGSHGDTVTKWDHKCGMPQLLDNVPANHFAGLGGTSPDTILRQAAATDSIRESDLWILITDGEIAEQNVTELTRLAEVGEVINVPVAILVVGGKYSSPSNTNISVGVPFFAAAREALILFKDYSTGHLYLIGAKGGFTPLKSEGSRGSIDLSSSKSIPEYLNEAAFVKRCGEMVINLTQLQGRRFPTKATSLGPEWDAATNALVDVSALLVQHELRLQDLCSLLGEEAITQLALICKTRGQLGTLRDLLLRHKQQEVMVRLEDRHGAGKIMEDIQNGSGQVDRLLLIEQLRSAHAANWATYPDLQKSPSEESRLITEINRLINRGLAMSSGFEKSSYTANIFSRKSNRAIEVLSAEESEVHLQALDLSDDIEAFRDRCPICCGEEQIMSVVLKKLDTVEENTTDFALNFPLVSLIVSPLSKKAKNSFAGCPLLVKAAGQVRQNANMISSHCICVQCVFSARGPSTKRTSWLSFLRSATVVQTRSTSIISSLLPPQLDQLPAH